MAKAEERDDQTQGQKGGKENAPGQNKEYNIIVNGQPKVHGDKWITFEQVVELGFGAAGNDGQTIYTVTYSRGEDSKPNGTLTSGEKVRVKDGMIFNVTPSRKS